MTKLSRLFTISLLLLLPLVAMAKPHILVIESYHQEYAWDQSYIKGLESVLADDYQLSYFQMDTKRIPSSRHRSRGEMAWQRYLDLKPDLVILGDDNALKYLGPRFAKTKLPVVYLGINNNPRSYHVHQRKNITGVLERPLIKRTVATVSTFMNEPPKRMLILFDDSTTSKTVLKETFGGNTQVNVSGIKLELRLMSSWSEWQDSINHLEEEGFDAVVFGLYHTLRDDKNKHVPAEQVIAWSAKNTSVPPFGFWDFSIGKDKAIGGLVLFGFEQGRLAAELAHTILTTNVVPHSLGPKTGEKGRYLFSRSQLERYNITLPDSINSKAIFID